MTSRRKIAVAAGIVSVLVVTFAVLGATGTFTSPSRGRTTTGAAVQDGRFPNAGNTGVPKGTVLSDYKGPTTITRCGTVIDSKVVKGGLDIRAGNGTHSAATPCVTIKNSLVNGPIDDSYTSVGYGPLLLVDDEINAPKPSESKLFDLYETNWYAWRVNVHGGIGGVQCDGYCEMHDSYVHDFYYLSPNHMGAFLSNGAYGAPILLDHNTFLCRIINTSDQDGLGGCTSDVNFLADFSPITNVTVSDNLLVANPADQYFCAYTGAAQPTKPYPAGTQIVWKNNTFQRGDSGKCGGTGPVYDWAYNAGNVWTGNHWDDGTVLNPTSSGVDATK